MIRPSVEAMINRTSGPFLEVGGPSQHLSGPPIVKFDKIQKPLIVSSFQPGYVLEAKWGTRLVSKYSRFSNEYFSTEAPEGLRGWLYEMRDLGFLYQDGKPARHPLDLYADANALPIATGGLGAIYASCLPRKITGTFVATEAPRTLEPGGILVVERIKQEAVGSITEHFDTIRIRKAGETTLHAVLQRNDMPYEQPLG